MQISDEAKEIIEKILTENNCDCLQVSVVKSCGGTSLHFSLANMGDQDKPISANGISMVMDEQIRARVEKLVISAEGGQLTIQDDEAASCSSCSYCS